MAVVKMREMNTHEAVYFDTADLSKAEMAHGVMRQNIPQHYVCPITARIYRKGDPVATYVCLQSQEELERLFKPDMELMACKENFTVDPASVKFTRVAVG